MCIGTQAIILRLLDLFQQNPSFRNSQCSSRKSSRLFGQRPRVFLLTSSSIGLAPQYLIALQVATNVSDWVITSVFSSTPDNFNDICSAAEPLTVDIAYFEPTYSETLDSNSSTNLPVLETNVESIVLSIYFFSLSSRGLKSLCRFK